MAKTMNMIMVARNMTRRPIRSDSQPPINAPTRAPPLRRSAHETQRQRRGVELLGHEHLHEGDGVQVPRLHQDGGHHQPADAVALGVVIGDQVADGPVHRGLLGKRGRHCLGVSRRTCCSLDAEVDRRAAGAGWAIRPGLATGCLRSQSGEAAEAVSRSVQPANDAAMFTPSAITAVLNRYAINECSRTSLRIPAVWVETSLTWLATAMQNEKYRNSP